MKVLLAPVMVAVLSCGCAATHTAPGDVATDPAAQSGTAVPQNSEIYGPPPGVQFGIGIGGWGGHTGGGVGFGMGW